MSGVIVCNPPGSKFGNATAQSFIHAPTPTRSGSAPSWCAPWIGELVFEMPRYQRPQGDALPVRSELTLGDSETNVEIRGYAQNQRAMIYTKSQAMEWLPIKESWARVSGYAAFPGKSTVVGHITPRSYIGLQLQQVSAQFIRPVRSQNARLNKNVAENFEVFCLVSELCPRIHPAFPPSIAFLPDFMMLMRAPILLRANSSFSWLAGLLSTGRVFSPIIDGKAGGREHDCEFAEGNWPRLSSLEGCTDMHVAP